MIEVSLFVDKVHVDRRVMKVAPRDGETIILDCGEMVRVIGVSHQWEDPEYIQINTMPFEEKEK